MSALAHLAVAAVLATSPLLAQEDAQHQLGRDAQPVLAAFRPAARATAKSVATLYAGERPLALATAVARDGLLVSKASELEGSERVKVGEELTCHLADGRVLAASVVARDPNYDLALVRVDARLEAVSWSATKPRVGQLVVSAGPSGEPLGAGLVGVLPKAITGGRARLGVVLAFGVEGAIVTRVSPDSAAAAAGVRVGDAIRAVDGQRVTDRRDAARAITRRSGAETVRLTLERDGETVEASVTLGVRAGSIGGRRSSLEGERSGVRVGFPSALQHDIVLAPAHCGGPLVGLDGNALGINIARAGRVASYAVPADVVREVVARLDAARGTEAKEVSVPVGDRDERR